MPLAAERAAARIDCQTQLSIGDGRSEACCVGVASGDHDHRVLVHRDLARQQIEGGLIYGLSLAVGSAIGFNGGLPTTSRLAGLNLPTLADSPQIAVEFVASDDPPFDPGELGTVIAAPAIANALSSATGQRFRSLPLDLASAQPS